MLDSEATKGAILGVDLKDEDGDIVTLTSITNNIINNITTTDPRQVFPTLWSLILDIPQKLLGLLALTATGYVYHEDDTFSIRVLGGGSALDWPLHKEFIGAAETLTIPTGFQYHIDGPFDVEGELDVEGTLVIT
jgi:hypothetical protein